MEFIFQWADRHKNRNKYISDNDKFKEDKLNKLRSQKVMSRCFIWGGKRFLFEWWHLRRGLREVKELAMRGWKEQNRLAPQQTSPPYLHRQAVFYLICHKIQVLKKKLIYYWFKKIYYWLKKRYKGGSPPWIHGNQVLWTKCLCPPKFTYWSPTPVWLYLDGAPTEVIKVKWGPNLKELVSL